MKKILAWNCAILTSLLFGCQMHPKEKVDASVCLSIESVSVVYFDGEVVKISTAVKNRTNYHIRGVMVLPFIYPEIPGYTIVGELDVGKASPVDYTVCISSDSASVIYLKPKEVKKITIVFHLAKKWSRNDVHKLKLKLKFLDGDVFGVVTSPIFLDTWTTDAIRKSNVPALYRPSP